MRYILALCFTVAAIAQAANNHSATLVWTDPGNPTGTLYNVYKVTGTCPATPPTLGNFGSFVKLNTTPVAQRTYVDLAITVGNAYCYFITAVPASGVGESAPGALTGTPVVPSVFPPGGLVLILQ